MSRSKDNVCRLCLCGPIHHPRCPSDKIWVQDSEALNEAELTQIEFMEEKLIPNPSTRYKKSESAGEAQETKGQSKDDSADSEFSEQGR